jgi:hypothetical protein
MWMILDVDDEAEAIDEVSKDGKKMDGNSSGMSSLLCLTI